MAKLIQKALDLFYELSVMNTSDAPIVIQLGSKDFDTVAEEMFKASGGRSDFRGKAQAQFMDRVTLLKGS